MVLRCHTEISKRCAKIHIVWISQTLAFGLFFSPDTLNFRFSSYYLNGWSSEKGSVSISCLLDIDKCVFPCMTDLHLQKASIKVPDNDFQEILWNFSFCSLLKTFLPFSIDEYFYKIFTKFYYLPKWSFTERWTTLHIYFCCHTVSSLTCFYNNCIYRGFFRFFFYIWLILFLSFSSRYEVIIKGFSFV